MQEIGNFDVKVNVVPNRLEKHMAFTVNRNLVFTESMRFMNSSLDTLVKKLSDDVVKYLSQKLCGELLQLVQKKSTHPYKYMDSFKKTFDDKLPDRPEL